ncbi:quinone oxidoreductase [Thermobispora bispora]|uniref:Alcohol dehydrogenase zinc-binding domain protein n=1 Tax=Thermobispora bispora (strain ATCC 19993 / DSM 43833 / CBS 139.67 / JCM 10125 / KCTC 9307 / NBRC 14880 / R51) TaxID=469371 RepID=D6Y579_THEBD|nr:quinone oxidoreductase [Thermobispora bispora]ADG89274.1 Alcohol dehydrogenase zinc-binding domain protein [Thermobispora bispora DSM 43833]MBO2473646.1 quinone oxidoreductase [Actinomycetales bacterium]MBX6167323.1 quinone oxidoreductase [Thermobispora bispora]QSI48949.1 quinone oxidoreductase [Thermobispora bispora]
MHAIVVSTYGDSSVLDYTERPDPQPGPGEVVVDVAASGVNFIDVYHREGRYPLPLPLIPGSEGAGTVTAVGPGVTDIVPGDRVAWAGVIGSYASKAVIPAERAVLLPDGVSAELAAAVMLQGMTAHYLTHSTYAIKQGDDVLIHAAAGGMGLLLTQMAKLRGARVIGTVSTPEKEKLARQAGADEVIGYEDFAAKVKEITGSGVHVVYDGVGAATFEGSLASLRPRGLLALYGAASGPVPPFDPQRLNAAGSLFLTRPSLNHYIATREELLWRAGDVLGWVASGALKVHISQRYPLAEARRAHDDLQARRTTGKLLLIP